MKTLYSNILIGLMFVFGIAGIAGIALGQFIASILFAITSRFSSNHLQIENNVA
ncbi:MAG: hypothetical protein QX192_03280 [Methylococcales bacterium]|jgi:hypothetical protein